ncbi:unnamed protein product [Malus baccata var. baccata]
MTLGVEEESEKLKDTNHVMIISNPIYEASYNFSISDNIAATQESNVVVEHSHLTQGVQICMPANQYPIFLHTNYKESEIGNISYPTMHGNYVQVNIERMHIILFLYNMHSSTSRGNDDQELN